MKQSFSPTKVKSFKECNSLNLYSWGHANNFLSIERIFVSTIEIAKNLVIFFQKN